jgi:peroxiredoxin
MSENSMHGPLQLGDLAPEVVLDAIAHDGKIALHGFRGRSAVLIGMFRGLHCPFCRRQIAAFGQLEGALHERGVESIAVVNTPVERARLYFRFHPLPNVIAASDPERVSHRAFGLPNLVFVENETETMLVDLPGELPREMNSDAAAEYLNKKDGYTMTEADQQMLATGHGQLIGEFLLDRDGVVRWSFTEAEGWGQNMFRPPNPQDVISAASAVLH